MPTSWLCRHQWRGARGSLRTREAGRHNAQHRAKRQAAGSGRRPAGPAAASGPKQVREKHPAMRSCFVQRERERHRSTRARSFTDEGARSLTLFVLMLAASATARPRLRSLSLPARNTSRESAVASRAELEPLGIGEPSHVRERAFSDVSGRPALLRVAEERLRPVGRGGRLVVVRFGSHGGARARACSAVRMTARVFPVARPKSRAANNRRLPAFLRLRKRGLRAGDRWRLRSAQERRVAPLAGAGRQRVRAAVRALDDPRSSGERRGRG
jgi:hypothetical protein